MATDKPRFTITLPDDVYASVMQYKEAHKISTQSKAIQRLIAIGLETITGKAEEKRDAVHEVIDSIAESFRALDQHGQKLVRMVIDAETDRVQAQAKAAEAVVVDLGTIRRYLSRPAAGVGGMVEGEDYEDIPRTPDMPPEADFCLVVSGDSMEPYIKNGETVFVSETAPIQPLEIGVWTVDGEAYIKQYYPLDDGGLMLLSANPAREAANLHIHPSGNQTTIYWGKVLGMKKLPFPKYR